MLRSLQSREFVGSESHDVLCLTAFPTPHGRTCGTVIAFGAPDVPRRLALATLKTSPSHRSELTLTAFRDALQITFGCGYRPHPSVTRPALGLLGGMENIPPSP